VEDIQQLRSRLAQLLAIPIPSLSERIVINNLQDAIKEIEARNRTTPVSVDKLPLPKGASTATNQLTDTELRATAVDVNTDIIQYIDGQVVTSNWVGNAMVFDNAGVITAVSDTNPMPTSAVLTATKDNGDITTLSSTAEGHLEVAIHSPRLPFGSIHTENLRPIFQTDAVYGINNLQVLTTTGHLTNGVTSGTNTGTNNVFTSSTGTTALSFATIQSRKRLRYRAGQGVVGRFAGFFSTPAASSILVAGFGTSESGFYYGYNGTSFGILHSTNGVREIQTLTVTVGAGGAENVTVKLNNVDTVVAVTSGSATNTAYQLSQATYTGWTATQRGATVIFLSNDVGDKASTFSLSSTGTTAGTFAETLAGVAATDTWIAQSSWNGDKLDGTGSSGYTINPQTGNVFQIGMQYLGFGTISFQIEITTADGNNADFVTVHTIKYPNTSTTTSIKQPSFPFTMAAYSSGSTTNVYVSVGSFGGFIEGDKVLTGPRMSYIGTASSTTSSYTPLFTVRNERVYNTRANQAIVQLLSISGAAKSTNGVTTFYIIRNATLSAGTPNFTQFATTSCTYLDTAATACTFSSNDQIVWAGITAESGNFTSQFEDDITIQPGETITVAVRSVTATAVTVASINTREDQ